MTEQKSKRIHIVINWVLLVTILLAISFSFYKYYYTEDFNYYVEANCDPSIETCFYRDYCEDSPDRCPPNGLTYYKAFYVKAYDFPICTDNGCAAECESGKILCEVIECDPEQSKCVREGLEE